MFGVRYGFSWFIVDLSVIIYIFMNLCVQIDSCKPNIYVSWSTSELRVRLAPLNRFKPSSKIFYWPFQGGTSFVDLLCFCSVLCLLCFVRVCLYVLFGHLLGKGWPLGSRLWCLLWVCHFPIGILGQVWYLIVSIPDLCTITYFYPNKLHGMVYSLMHSGTKNKLFCIMQSQQILNFHPYKISILFPQTGAYKYKIFHSDVLFVSRDMRKPIMWLCVLRRLKSA